MADQSNTNLAAPNNVSAFSNASVPNPAATVETNRFKTQNNADDDLIASLQNRVENRRARQVFEWETARRQIFAFNNL